MVRQKRVFIWDLDGTVICSDHRLQPCFKADGSLDLVKYSRDACTHDLIMQDTLKPLSVYMRSMLASSNDINVICTARKMSKSDYYYLRKQGLRAGRGGNIQLLSRDVLHRYCPPEILKDTYYGRDAIYKTVYFEYLKAKYPDALFTMIDDNQSVLKAAADCGFQTLDAAVINDILQIGCTIVGEQFLDDALDDDNDYGYLIDRLGYCWESMTEEEQAEYSVKPNYIIDRLTA